MVSEKNSIGQDEGQKLEQEISDSLGDQDQKDHDVSEHGEKESEATVTSFMVSSSSSYTASSMPREEAAVEAQNTPTFMAGRIWRWSKPLFIVFLVLYFIYLVAAKTPAAWAAWSIHSAAPNVWLTGVSGTLWNGVARGSQVDLASSSLPLGELRWTLNPWSLLALSPCIAFETSIAGQLASGEACHSLTGTTRVKDMVVEAPVAVVAELLPMPAAGQFSLQVVSASFDTEKVKHIEGSASWQNARVNPDEGWLSLGSFGATLSAADDGGVKAEIIDLEGPFSMAFDAEWYPLSESWTLRGTVTPKDNAPDLVVQALQVVGEEVESGTYEIIWP